jgi:molecular chaperone HscB
MPSSFPQALQMCRECGGGAPIDVHFCPQCTKILSLSRHGDYFHFFGLPRRLNLDVGDLEQRFRTLSRQFHPDFFYNATPAERLASLERSSYLNDGYRMLHHPISRIEYLLKIEGLAPKSPEDASRQVPPALLEEVFALNEELDEVREMRGSGASADAWKERLQRARGPIDVKRIEHERQLQELAERWDALVGSAAPETERAEVLTALHARFLERNYITNLLAGIERELEAG